jgi:hypothetical protein
MGINLEYVTLLTHLRQYDKLPPGNKICEFGAQDISADPIVMAAHLERCGFHHQRDSVHSAKELYQLFGFNNYISIDATAEHGALTFDLNKNLRDSYGFSELYDLVTDLGTFEHVFDIACAFRNAHEVCQVGGLMIHVLPSNCNANHGYYTIQPRMIADISAANAYEIVEFVFTVDYKPVLYRYDLKTYKDYDDRDLLVYVVLRKTVDQPFIFPFDSIFTEKNTLSEYKQIFTTDKFLSYIKSSWENVRPKNLNEVPTGILTASTRRRKFLKWIINRLGRYY